jgi:hypothetical protein
MMVGREGVRQGLTRAVLRFRAERWRMHRFSMSNGCLMPDSQPLNRWGINCVLVRDLTDTMYNTKKAPFVTHDEGTELVVKHIEK